MLWLYSIRNAFPNYSQRSNEIQNAKKAKIIENKMWKTNKQPHI